VLVEHDRALWAQCGVAVEAVELLCGSDDAAASLALAAAVEAARGLYGREPALDAFLRATRQGLLALTGSDLRAKVQSFRELLASLPMI